MPSILLHGGRVIDPASGTDAAIDVAIKDGRIAALGAKLPRADAEEMIDAKGSIVCPGLIDPHVHLREPGHEHKETIDTGARAAAAGGFTTVCCMPNTSPALDSAAMIEFIARRAEAALAVNDTLSRPGSRGDRGDRGEALGRARVFAVGAATQGRKGEALAEIALMARAGAVGFSDDGDCIASAGMMSRALAAIAPTGLAFMQHAQEPTMTAGASMHAGEVSTRLGLTGWPAAAEEIIVERDVSLARLSGARYHVQHMSSGGSVEILRRARAEEGGANRVTGEASPHHLLLTDAACEGYNTSAKMNPPLRTERDARALREGVAEGVITTLATDHAPHTADEKSNPFEAAPFGIVGLETALALYAEALVHSGLIGWPALIALLTINPARLCNLDRKGLGMLKVGGPADVTVIDPDARWTIGPGDIVGKCANTPFLGRAVRGRATTTIVDGKIAMHRA